MRQLGIEFEEIQVPLRQPGSLQHKLSYSLAGKVPSLIHGETCVWDSLAIVERLAEAFPEKGYGWQIRRRVPTLAASQPRCTPAS